MGPETPCDTLDETSHLTSASLGVPTCNVGAESHLPCLAAGFGLCSNTICVAVEEWPTSLPGVLDRILCNKRFAFSVPTSCPSCPSGLLDLLVALIPPATTAHALSSPVHPAVPSSCITPSVKPSLTSRPDPSPLKPSHITASPPLASVCTVA